MIAFILYSALIITCVVAQGCGNDVLVDDFSTTQNKFFDNADREINKLGGDYGTDGNTTFTIDTDSQTLTVIPQENDMVFFYAKYVIISSNTKDEGACFDLTNYYAFQFDLLAPEGATGTFTLTQSSPDCSERVANGDSNYLPLSRYYSTPGQRQTVVLPFQDFKNLASGNGTFDFEHLKDWTFVNPKPLGEPFVFSNMILLGGAPGCNGTTVSNGTTVPSNGTTDSNGTTVSNGTTDSDGTTVPSNGTDTNTSTPNGLSPASNNGDRKVFSVFLLVICLLFV